MSTLRNHFNINKISPQTDEKMLDSVTILSDITDNLFCSIISKELFGTFNFAISVECADVILFILQEYIGVEQNKKNKKKVQTILSLMFFFLYYTMVSLPCSCINS